MKVLTMSALMLSVIGMSGSLAAVTCQFYNRTPFDVIFSLDMPFARDKEITIPAGEQEVLNTGIYPVRSFLVYALINRHNNKGNDKDPKKVLIYESRGMKFINLKCALFIEPLLVKEDENGKKKLHLNALKFWATHETPSHGEQLNL
jgi:hypothetical protein